MKSEQGGMAIAASLWIEYRYVGATRATRLLAELHWLATAPWEVRAKPKRQYHHATGTLEGTSATF